MSPRFASWRFRLIARTVAADDDNVSVSSCRQHSRQCPHENVVTPIRLQIAADERQDLSHPCEIATCPATVPPKQLFLAARDRYRCRRGSQLSDRACSRETIATANELGRLPCRPRALLVEDGPGAPRGPDNCQDHPWRIQYQNSRPNRAVGRRIRRKGADAPRAIPLSGTASHPMPSAQKQRRERNHAVREAHGESSDSRSPMRPVGIGCGQPECGLVEVQFFEFVPRDCYRGWSSIGIDGQRQDLMTTLLERGREVQELTWEILMDEENAHAVIF